MNEEILHLLKQYADTGTLREDQARVLRDWRSRSEYNEQLMLMLDDPQLLAAAIRESDRFATGKEASWQRLKAMLPQEAHVEPARRVHFLRTAWFRYAAILLLVAGTVTLLFINRQPDQQTTVAAGATHPGILPGGNRAILTLADGTMIPLDSATNGAIAQQGNTRVIKLADGRIVYNPQGGNGNEVLMNTMRTPRGGQYQLTLPDGSKVWLNAASSISFPAAFTGSSRKIRISGEVYLEVAANRAKPFIADIEGGGSIEVLGTAFNINSYTNEAGVKTTLVEGSVRVNAGDHKAVLKPGQQAVYATGQNNTTVANGTPARQASPASAITVRSADIEQTLAWKNGVFNFQNMNFMEAARQLERWYDIEVVYRGKVPDIQFKGGMDRNVNLQEIVQLLKGWGVDAAMEGRKLVIR